MFTNLIVFFVLMIRRPPVSTRTDPLLPYTPLFRSWLVLTLAPGFADDPGKLALAIEFSRITFPYLLFTAAMALMAGELNGLYRFGAAAAAPLVLHVCMILPLLCFSGASGRPGHAMPGGAAAAGLGQCRLPFLAMSNAGMIRGPGLSRLSAAG